MREVGHAASIKKVHHRQKFGKSDIDGQYRRKDENGMCTHSGAEGPDISWRFNERINNLLDSSRERQFWSTSSSLTLKRERLCSRFMGCY